MNLNTPQFPIFPMTVFALPILRRGDPAGDPVLLIHGFASSANVNWVHPAG